MQIKNYLQLTISPHLSIYKPQYNSITSILFRVSGVILLSWIFSVDFPGFYMTGQLYQWFTQYIILIFGSSLVYHVCLSVYTEVWAFFRPIKYFVLDDFELSSSFNFQFWIYLNIICFIYIGY